MSDDLWSEIKHFRPSEFDSPDAPGSGQLMNIEFIKLLNKIRAQCQFPFTINSGYRTKEHNAVVAQVEKSAHTTGNACDISAHSGLERFAIVKYALENGITRIGIANSFVHLDLDYTKPQSVIWLYSNDGTFVEDKTA